MLADFLQSLPLPALPTHLTSWKPGLTPMSTVPVVAGTVMVYLSTVFAIRDHQKTREPQKLNTLFQIHNFLLSAGSGLLLVLMLEEILPIMWKHGVFYAICGEGAWTERLEFYYLINYYFKYWELVDTVFLALKKKPLTFLHVFHHAATAVLCYTQLDGKTSVSWVVITLNLAITITLRPAGGKKIWWKKYITTMQITQFVIDIVVVYFATYSHFAYMHNLPTVGDCAGDVPAALYGCALLTFYLVLFIDFYRRTYNAKPKGAAKNGVANGKPIANGNGASH
ncbi:Putative elongation of fatty acids protein 1 {ECO:0000250/UniProtKB:P40319} {ECO:0000250/UniProtKB:P40319}; AltName: Full=3-keto acyl-CoA synthase SPAC1B2.03c {ECO:0000250/UniProtKB:P40319}; AltName: Full=Very-long-chain 3-oxoacyl-CoA synthase 1 {ECO:0000250/UniProtKB:P40319} [Serendipita indica DSM 11827]|nr:Putative elongation of fatty acids protein 1 {ECO:0000250/UniProtKB:P40319} {ECO:0000250/UniProtKB:P40319}; AltName: Full=3-keto acyl-CoA synthase SPAC1B2.03c {ECO:0000250/UniProtKB:P40319}; AltName: Full=Very-long-chain 3-oxoacyl-CoA synthase 1 {ECO:0000250/UniProtKB:P40319} [Serendipita indica DSM 11827]